MMSFIKYSLFLTALINVGLIAQTLTETKLLPPVLRNGERFGHSIGVLRNELLVGAEQAYYPVNGTGSVYRYFYNGNNWQYIERMDCPSGLSGASFGYSIAIDDGMLIIGAPEDTSGGLGWPKGAVYVYNRADTSWVLSQRLEPNTDYGAPFFGSSIAFSDSLLLIGAKYDQGDEFLSGTAYIFKKRSEIWTEIKRIVGPGAHEYSEFGASAAIYNNFLFIGAPQLNDSGAVFMYKIENDSVQFINKVVGSSVSLSYSFGRKIINDSNMIAISASGNIYSQNYHGSIYIYQLEGENLTELNIIYPEDPLAYYFGYGISLKKDSILIGAIGNTGVGDKGRGYLYVKDDSIWREKIRFIASDGANLDFFGQTCDFDNGAFVFGAPGKGIAGAVYIYQDISVGGIVEDNINKFEYSLSQNYPNPFNPKTKIRYNIPTEGNVKLIIYNTLGEEITTLSDERKVSGYYEVEFNASNLPSGMYIYKFQAGSYMDVKKMILVK